MIPNDWPRYFDWASARAGYDTTIRGWSTRLTHDAGISDGQISRWRQGRIPDVVTCRKLARVWKRPLLEVLVGSGAITADEARWQDRPTQAPEAPSASELRLRRVLNAVDSPTIPPQTRHRVELLLDIIGDQLASASRRGTAES